MSFPLRLPAIEVNQPLGTFYAVSITAEILLQVSYTIKAEILNNESEDNGVVGFLNKLTGTQRERKKSRIEEIKRYSETVDASFPNSIILGANFKPNGTMITEVEERWYIEENGDCKFLIIPTNKSLASIIDGQHRVYGFKDSSKKSMNLICSVFLDLPMPYHAQIFTNINMNQKRVDKNLAYNLFQFDMNQGDIKGWSPETLAVYYARILEKDDNSPLKNQLKIGLTNEINSSSISMASIIDGILSLITNNPKKDREILHLKSSGERHRKMLKDINSSAPLRELYINGHDKTIYNIILNYFKIIVKIFWKEKEYLVFKKTLGIQALFDFLKIVIIKNGIRHDYSTAFFETLLKKTNSINFNDNYFGIQTKVRTRIKNTLLIVTGLSSVDTIRINQDELNELKSFLHIS